ncbi:MAG: nitroreductase [Acetatifactor sp.]|nr:nitroreductase [Acetatifactor sp.]
MDNITETIRNRRSVRTFDGKEIIAEDMEKLSSFMAKIDNPYDIPVEFKILNAKEQKLSCPVVSGTDIYVGAKVRRAPHIEEAFGYSFEKLVLYAQSLGIGTVWVGGTMDRAAFERAMNLSEDEMMPCVSPLGYPSKKMSVKENMMRKATKANSRLPFESLFFDGTFDVPLTEEKAGSLAGALEMVRWAPSAVNKQPWRVVVDKNAAHFYLKRNKGFISDAAGNLQKIDLGIALCHFALAAKESGLSISLNINDPGITTESDTEYIASYLFMKA